MFLRNRLFALQFFCSLLWHMTHGGWWTFSHNFSSLALTVYDLWCFVWRLGGKSSLTYWLTELINEQDKGDLCQSQFGSIFTFFFFTLVDHFWHSGTNLFFSLFLFFWSFSGLVCRTTFRMGWGVYNQRCEQQTVWPNKKIPDYRASPDF